VPFDRLKPVLHQRQAEACPTSARAAQAVPNSIGTLRDLKAANKASGSLMTDSLVDSRSTIQPWVSLRVFLDPRCGEVALIARKLVGIVTRTHVGRTVAEGIRPVYHMFDPWTGLHGLDRRLMDYLPEGPGFFIEAGANDGLRQSNTYYLEQRCGWRGLLVEPIPRLAARCRRNRPAATVVNAALVDPVDEGRSIFMADDDLMSNVNGVRGDANEDQAHLVPGASAESASRRPLSVAGRTLSGIIDEVRLPQVDFLSLDVEGYEFNALRGLDLSRHAPMWMLVETADPAGVADLLGSQFERVGPLSHHDWLFRHCSRG
jgi:FkbM family methyltransferase